MRIIVLTGGLIVITIGIFYLVSYLTMRSFDEN